MMDMELMFKFMTVMNQLKYGWKISLVTSSSSSLEQLTNMKLREGIIYSYVLVYLDVYYFILFFIESHEV